MELEISQKRTLELGNMLETIRIQTNREMQARQDEANRNKAIGPKVEAKAAEVQKDVTEVKESHAGQEEAATDQEVKLTQKNSQNSELKDESNQGQNVDERNEV